MISIRKIERDKYLVNVTPEHGFDMEDCTFDEISLNSFLTNFTLEDKISYEDDTVQSFYSWLKDKFPVFRS